MFAERLRITATAQNLRDRYRIGHDNFVIATETLHDTYFFVIFLIFLFYTTQLNKIIFTKKCTEFQELKRRRHRDKSEDEYSGVTLQLY